MSRLALHQLILLAYRATGKFYCSVIDFRLQLLGQ